MGAAPPLQPAARSAFEAAFSDASVPQRFQEMVQRHPQRLALSAERSLTYAQLNEEIEGVAAALAAAAPLEACRVVVCMPQGADQVICLLACLRAGLVYAPIEPGDPPERNQRIIALADPSLIVTAGAQSAGDSAVLNARVKTITFAELATRAAPAAAVPLPPPDAPAYLLFTSGSTGLPKGVCQSHRNLLHHIRSYSNGLELTEQDRVSLFFSTCFSAALMDTFGALLNGAALFPHYLLEYPVTELRSWIEQQQITVLHSVPTVLRRFLDTLPGAAPACVRVVDVAGELLTCADVDRYYSHFADHQLLINHLGVTECSVAAQAPVRKSDPRKDPLPVGAPPAGVQLLVVDDDGVPVPAEVPGRLVIRSAYCAKEYWRAPELSAGTFTAHDSGEVDYRSGDRAVMSQDGAVFHLGRGDDRIKLRGYTVESAEVERALREHPAVAEAVLSLTEQWGRPCLGAHLTLTAQHSEPTARQLREHLRERLPLFMVPAVYAWLPAMPRTLSGKIDRRSLPRIVVKRAAPRPPSDEIQALLLGVWRRVLGIAELGLDDDFFDLGGDSLIALQLVSELEQLLPVKLSVSALLRAPTVDELAALIQAQSFQAELEPLVPLQPLGTGPALFCFHPASGDVFVYHQLARHLGQAARVYGLQSPNRHDHVIHRTVEEMAEAYVEAITGLNAPGTTVLVGYSFGGMVAFEVAQRLQARGQVPSLLVMVDAPLHETRLERVQRHLRRLRALPGTSKLRYVTDRLPSSKAESPQAPAPVSPVKLRYDLMLPLVTQAMHAYQPRPYSGKVASFDSADRDQELWKRFMTGPVSTRHLNAPHLELFNEPHVALIAQALREELNLPAARG